MRKKRDGSEAGKLFELLQTYFAESGDVEANIGEYVIQKLGEDNFKIGEEFALIRNSAGEIRFEDGEPSQDKILAIISAINGDISPLHELSYSAPREQEASRSFGCTAQDIFNGMQFVYDAAKKNLDEGKASEADLFIIQMHEQSSFRASMEFSEGASESKSR